jgi:pimeloyl-ACP methyl ester carboxylesterase
VPDHLSRPDTVPSYATTTVESSDGVTIPIYDLGGDGPPLLLCHATGLHGRVYLPLLARLRSSFHCVTVDLRGQGSAGVPANDRFAWDAITDDVAAVLDAIGWAGRGDVAGIGHSMGGFAVMTAEERRPGTFSQLFAFEPVIFPVDPTRTSDVMAGPARKRRRVFASRTEAYENYRSKLPFSTIDDDCVRAYVDWGFRDLSEGTVTLLCEPENEAKVFENSMTTFYDRLPDFTVPTVFGVAEFTNEGFAMFVPRHAERAANGTLMRFEQRTHFGLLERIDDMAAVITDIFGA